MSYHYTLLKMDEKNHQKNCGDSATLDNNLAVPFKTKNGHTLQANNFTPRYLSQRNKDLFQCKNLYMNFHSSFTHKANPENYPKVL